MRVPIAEAGWLVLQLIEIAKLLTAAVQNQSEASSSAKQLYM